MSELFDAGKRRWLLLMMLSGVMAVAVGFGLPTQIALQSYAYGGPILAFVSATALVLALLPHLALRNRRGFDLAVAALVMAVVALHIPAERRIDSDESRMIATAQSIRLTGSAYAVDSGIYRQDGTLVATSATLDKRGVFFPAMIAALDSVLGPNQRHALWLSWISGLFALFLTARLARRMLSATLAPFAPILLGILPVFANHARVGTFDVMNLACALLFIHATVSCWRAPTIQRTLLLAASGCVLSQIRYESAALVGLTLALVMAGSLFFKKYAHLKRVALILPWAMIPAAWRRIVPFDDLIPAPWFSAWSVDNFRTNIEHLAAFSITGGQVAMGNPWLTAAWFLLLIGLPLRWRKLKDYERSSMIILGFVTTMIIVPTTIILFYFWGKANLNFTVRYFLPFSVLLVFCSLTGIALAAERQKGQLVLATGLLLGSAIWAYPRTINAGLLDDLAYAYKIKLISFEVKNTGFQCSNLIIADHGLVFTIHGFSSMTADEFKIIGADEVARIAGASLHPINLSESLYRSDDYLRGKLRALASGSCTQELKAIDFSRLSL